MFQIKLIGGNELNILELVHKFCKIVHFENKILFCAHLNL